MDAERKMHYRIKEDAILVNALKYSKALVDIAAEATGDPELVDSGISHIYSGDWFGKEHLMRASKALLSAALYFERELQVMSDGFKRAAVAQALFLRETNVALVKAVVLPEEEPGDIQDVKKREVLEPSMPTSRYRAKCWACDKIVGVAEVYGTMILRTHSDTKHHRCPGSRSEVKDADVVTVNSSNDTVRVA